MAKNSTSANMRLVLNGKAAADESVRAAVTAFREAGHALEVRVTWEGGHAEQFAREAAEAGYRAVIAAGGDGTLNEVVNGLLAASTSDAKGRCGLGVLPFGTANDFAVGCGIPIDPVEALALIDSRPTTLIDVGKVNDRYFLNCATGGYGAQVTAETPPEMKKVLGGFAYFLTGLAGMTTLTPRAIALAGPDFEWRGDVLGLVIANGRQSGGGFQTAPNSLLNDGLLDLLVIPDAPLPEMLSLFGELNRLGGKPGDYAQLIHRQIQWLEVETSEGLHMNIDGEPIEADRFRFEAVPRCLPCFLPAEAPLALAPIPGENAPASLLS